MADSSAVELRGMCPREIVDLLDAVSAARRMTRMDLVIEVLRSYAVEQRHIANVVVSVTRGNPQQAES